MIAAFVGGILGTIHFVAGGYVGNKIGVRTKFFVVSTALNVCLDSIMMFPLLCSNHQNTE